MSSLRSYSRLVLQHPARLSMQVLYIPGLYHCGDYLSQDQNPPEEVVLDDLLDGPAEERYLHALP